MDREAFQSVEWGRKLLGNTPQCRADYAFFQHLLKRLKPKPGRCAILWPHGVLFRNEEHEMRAKLVALDWVDAVIGLGPNLFYNSPMESCVVVCRLQKPPKRRGKILFINALGEVTRERAQSFLTPEHQVNILKAFRDFKDIPGFARVASLEEVEGNKANLSIPLYVRPASQPEAANGNGKGLKQAWRAWQNDGREFWKQMDGLTQMLDDLLKEKPGRG